MNNVDKLHLQFKKDLSKSTSTSDLDNLHIKYLGRKGLINKLLQSIYKLRPEEKKELGKKVNELKTSINQLIGVRRQEVLKKAKSTSYVDMTLPGKQYPKGSLHLVSYAIEEISKIFQKIGFIRMTYPEVEWEYFSFDALNMPPGHPARDDFETFFIDYSPKNLKYGKMILSPHTSSGQVREMLRVKKPPIRMINIAKCYRPNWDTTHTPMFHQFEGLCIDENINITHLKGTIDYFAKEFFGENREIRLRPAHFQFTEPSFEPDITCGVCLGKGVINERKCRVCKSGWLELAGAGMVHPNVLSAGGIDPEKYTGWAFGFGIERVTMMKEGIMLDDMRILYDNDIRFLSQF
ncbi:phenylalanine--tRNA ligase subunit alpha [Candidatus Roizmanbacteria bacterium RIFCSPHIGHO2_12_FULL_37_9b]|uniref:Phenylalanine--tRNA ligase alpha subunit n=1 Tax=Candidatus Roizmanbacteria bacterium RIFCSPHIGHO2_02_FULL_38_11 TaxID=1802039 RepID=A0A1F7H444_9BACT|nr:MAG: phenylalanine--tRNA ligase subunit alpha [Candidatus Roizmanbacteria bacterium RIFCSPHIGHO2_02_FULL_38_11]OGK35144.1 MAG: phenylalanine--tRNA ligase subunit alpha [Candidatus Roizmanbacteria bacterium RIFCSPHIGHO2_12_FULL_37_9b]